jgi:hypothetical protein
MEASIPPHFHCNLWINSLFFMEYILESQFNPMFFIEHKKYSGKKYLLLKEILSFILNYTLETILLIAIVKIMVLRVITLKKT